MFILFYLVSTLWYEDWTNAGIDELLIRLDDKPTLFTEDAPLGRGELSRFLNNSNPIGISELRLTDKLNEKLENYERSEYSAGIISDSVTREAVLIGKGMHTTFLTVFVEPIIKFGKGYEYPTNMWHDFLGGDYLQGYIKLSGFGTSVTVGREPMKWGPSPRNTLILSGNAPPFDMFKLNYCNTKLKFTFFGTQLDALSGFLGINRYFTGHRLEYKINNSLYTGFSEVALFGGTNNFPTLYYFNPIFIYYPYQWNRSHSKGCNILWSFDSKLLLHNVGIYGEFMIDDYPYAPDDAGDRPKIGGNVGLQWAIGDNYFLAEYTNVTRWTYDHVDQWQRYTYLGYCIGNPNGPDFDETFFGVNHHLSKNTDILFDYSFLRKGEGIINEVYPDNFPAKYWLTGTLKYANKPEIGVQINKGITISCKVGYITGTGGNTPVFSLFLQNSTKVVF